MLKKMLTMSKSVKTEPASTVPQQSNSSSDSDSCHISPTSTQPVVETYSRKVFVGGLYLEQKTKNKSGINSSHLHGCFNSI